MLKNMVIFDIGMFLLMFFYIKMVGVIGLVKGKMGKKVDRENEGEIYK